MTAPVDAGRDEQRGWMHPAFGLLGSVHDTDDGPVSHWFRHT